MLKNLYFFSMQNGNWRSKSGFVEAGWALGTWDREHWLSLSRRQARLPEEVVFQLTLGAHVEVGIRGQECAIAGAGIVLGG